MYILGKVGFFVVQSEAWARLLCHKPLIVHSAPGIMCIWVR